MQGTSRILSLGIVVREIILAQDLFSDAEDGVRYPNSGPTRGWNESKRGEVNAKGNNRHRENPKNSSHRLYWLAAASLLFKFCSCFVLDIHPPAVTILK